MKVERRWTAKKIILLVYDIGISILSILLSVYFLSELSRRAGFELLREQWYVFPLTALPTYYVFGFYDQMWVYASLMEYALVAGGVFIQTLLVSVGMQIFTQRFPAAVYILYFFICSLGVLAIRVMYRIYSNYFQKKQSKELKQWGKPKRLADGQADTIRILIIGAGAAGSQIVRELKAKQALRVPIGMVDDNPLTHTFKNQGVPVLGSRKDIPQIVETFEIDEIILAIPSASSENIRDIMRYCQQTPAQIKTVPFLPQILNGRFSLSDIRNVEIEDLLGRDEIALDPEPIKELIRDKVVMVTGGGGSIGSELSRQIADFHPKALILFDIYENNVYDLQQELLAKYGKSLDLRVLIGSVRDTKRLREVFEKHRPNIVFHAAAHKHVPLMETSRGEVIKNNVFGTYNVAKIAGEFSCSHMVLISTDKAVNPTNAMGASKRLAEMITLAMNKEYPSCIFTMVRFGNVLGSNGSVIPLFKRQIKNERRVTVTDPNVTRYFMTIPEAASLVLQAACYAKGGEIFVLDMGKPVKIDNLARELIRLSGFEPDVDIPVEYIGLRPGEKMYEELYLYQEKLDKTSHRKIMIVQQKKNRPDLEEEIQTLLGIINYPNENLKELLESALDHICA